MDGVLVEKLEVEGQGVGRGEKQKRSSCYCCCDIRNERAPVPRQSVQSCDGDHYRRKRHHRYDVYNKSSTLPYV